jgi:hypothetical protein
VASEPRIEPRFFALEDDVFGHSDTKFFQAEPHHSAEAPVCSRCGGAIGSRVWLAPYRAELELHGESFGDFVKGPGDDVLISERFAELFRAEGLTGFSGFHLAEVERVRKKARPSKAATAPRYAVVTPCIGRGAVDEARSRVRRLRPITCPECRYGGASSIHGFALEQGTWQGEDVFRPRGLYGRIVVSERFAELASRHGLTNVKLTPIEELIWDPLGRGPPEAAPSSPGHP